MIYSVKIYNSKCTNLIESSSVEPAFFKLIRTINHDNGVFILKQRFQK